MRRIVVLAVLLLAAVAPAHADRPTPEAKLAHYVKGHNFLVGTFGLQVEYERYAAQHVARKAVGDMVSISLGWLEQGQDELKQAQAMGGGELPEVDAAAGPMVAILDRLA